MQLSIDQKYFSIIALQLHFYFFVVFDFKFAVKIIDIDFHQDNLNQNLTEL